MYVLYTVILQDATMSARRFLALIAILILLITHAQSAETSTSDEMNTVKRTVAVCLILVSSSSLAILPYGRSYTVLCLPFHSVHTLSIRSSSILYHHHHHLYY